MSGAVSAGKRPSRRRRVKNARLPAGVWLETKSGSFVELEAFFLLFLHIYVPHFEPSRGLLGSFFRADAHSLFDGPAREMFAPSV